MIERAERTKLARQWLAKAEEDLVAARHLATCRLISAAPARAG
jgi:phage anti-repressor protein